MVHIFLSDVHLGGFSSKKNKRLENELIRLVDYCESNKIQIHILGDLFDYWMEFPNYIPELGRAILDRFEKYNSAMSNETIYLTGNHDYWTVSHFEERGFKVEHEFVEMELDQKKVFLCHGDGLKEKKFQLPRPLLHRFIRNPKFITFYKTVLTGKVGVGFMKNFSAFTRDEEDTDTERLNNWAKYMLKTFPYDVIISGHDHIPRKETFPGGSYLNSGSFHKHRSLIKYTKGVFKLVNWSEDSDGFTAF
ncbi:MAG: UDP-2,3-diacylglucosamine diphosphatase [Balneolaceae bacterium]|nr:UDP-2,3-diacylglucosamine diphosphatase [Balneolaceae bacterium]